MKTTRYNLGPGEVIINFSDGCKLVIDVARVALSMNSEDLHDDATITLKFGAFSLKTPHQAIRWSKREGVVYKHWTDELRKA